MSAKKKLSDADVRWIKRVGRRAWTTGVSSLADLAKIVGCSRNHVHDILLGKRRASVSEDEP